MKGEIIEIGTISSRGQIAIPASIRTELGLEDGSKILFLVQDETILMRKVKQETFAQLTQPLREANKKIKEDQVVDVIHKLRKQWQKSP